MGKRKELEKTEEVVECVLEEYEEARNSDDVLYFRVCQMIEPSVAEMPFKDIILRRKEHYLPAYSSVARVGRKVRRLRPELSGSDLIEHYRKENEDDYREYARK